jgi:HD-like signal output (HDOD) protein/CheY-like chemotaxis protein
MTTAETLAARLTVLFVDDEPNVLEGLRRSTRRLSSTWDLHFADSGKAALALIDRVPRVDVVVTDMRMPQMDGADLLMRIRACSPTTTRIILSGQSDHEAVYRAIGPAHQYLAKPCDVDTLVDVIARLGAGPCTSVQEPVRTFIGQVDRLPPQPEVFVRLTAELASPNSDIGTIGEIVAADVALTTEMLRMVNSAFFGVYGEVDSIERAVSLLGMDVVRGLVLGSRLFEPIVEMEPWLDLRALATRSRSIAFAARGLALRAGATHATAGGAFLAGMVSEVGLLVFARIADVVADDLARLNNECDIAAELATFGGNRFCVGSTLLRLWGFSPAIVEAVCDLGNPMATVPDGIAWCLRSARGLVLDVGVDSAALADPDTPIATVDPALEQLRRYQGQTERRAVRSR